MLVAFTHIAAAQERDNADRVAFVITMTVPDGQAELPVDGKPICGQRLGPSPVHDVARALPFYERVLGFRLRSRSDTPHKSAVLALNQIQIGLAENGGDSSDSGD